MVRRAEGAVTALPLRTCKVMTHQRHLISASALQRLLICTPLL